MIERIAGIAVQHGLQNTAHAIDDAVLHLQSVLSGSQAHLTIPAPQGNEAAERRHPIVDPPAAFGDHP